MALQLVQVNFKARDSALGRFWAEALGWGVSSEGPGVTNFEPLGFVWPDPVAVCVDVVTVRTPKRWSTARTSISAPPPRPTRLS
ncbi:hypothetical protein QFZ40_003138 [Arthrobacter pascens]|uniref:hypothetical protein n=1 Tax=Arthrobacter pascens TaxID=1677 RepID=UPI00277E2611|nr:hypothetical protein [Arthrobacter pascens]MDQ0635229.1 hypothetical protein [Arthrobacter pascens]